MKTKIWSFASDTRNGTETAAFKSEADLDAYRLQLIKDDIENDFSEEAKSIAAMIQADEPFDEIWEYWEENVKDPLNTYTWEEHELKIDSPEYDELRKFVGTITLQLQKHRSLSEEQFDDLFQQAYQLYVKHDVENLKTA